MQAKIWGALIGSPFAKGKNMGRPRKDGTPSVSKKTQAKTVKEVDNVKEVTPIEEKVAVLKPKQRRIYNSTDEIIVRSANSNPMRFISRRNPYVTAYWEKYGDEDSLTFQDLREMAAEQPKFFTKNWISVDSDVLAQLRMDRYYQNALTPEEYENLFNIPMNGSEAQISARLQTLKTRIEPMTDLQKETLVSRIACLIEDGKIDSDRLKKFLGDMFKTQFVI